MANDRTSMDEQNAAPERDRTNADAENVRGNARDDIRGVAEEEDEEFEDTDDLEEDEDSDGSF